MRNGILLHLGVELFLEGLHPVVAVDDLRKIHLLTYHHLVHKKDISITNIVS